MDTKSIDYSAPNKTAEDGLYRFNPQRCNLCPNPNDGKRVFPCSRCYLLCYCSKEHQKLDLLHHQDLCKAVKDIYKELDIVHISELYNAQMKYDVDEIHTPSTVPRIRASYVFLMRLQAALGRTLENWEIEMVNHPRICKKCGVRTCKVECTKCFGVIYCSDKCMKNDEENHYGNCQSLKILYNFVLPIAPTDKFIRPDIYAPKKKLKDCEDLFDVMTQLTRREFVKIPKTIEDCNAFRFVDSHANAVTIASLLECFKPNVHHVHIMVVGAEREFEQLSSSYNVMCELMPHVKSFWFKCVGPNQSDEEPHFKTLFNADQPNEQQYHVDKEIGLLKECNWNTHLFIAFNCGFAEKVNTIEVNPWDQGIATMLMADDAIIAFTSYNGEEAHHDLAVLQRVAINVGREVDVRIPPRKNAFKNVMPVRDMPFFEEEVYFANNYLTVVASRPKCII